MSRAIFLTSGACSARKLPALRVCHRFNCVTLPLSVSMKLITAPIDVCPSVLFRKASCNLKVLIHLGVGGTR